MSDTEILVLVLERMIIEPLMMMLEALTEIIVILAKLIFER